MSNAYARINDGNGHIYFVDISELKFEERCLGPLTVEMRGYVRQESKEVIPKQTSFTAERVIFNPPATVAIWDDGTKTVVKCDPKDTYDPKYGLALCYMKKALGNKSRGLNDALRAGMGGWNEEKSNEQNEPVRRFLKEHEVAKHLIRDDYEGVCPIVGTPCPGCPYRGRPFSECVPKIRNDIKRMTRGEKDNHD